MHSFEELVVRHGHDVADTCCDLVDFFGGSDDVASCPWLESSALLSIRSDTFGVVAAGGLR